METEKERPQAGGKDHPCPLDLKEEKGAKGRRKASKTSAEKKGKASGLLKLYLTEKGKPGGLTP